MPTRYDLHQTSFIVFIVSFIVCHGPQLAGPIVRRERLGGLINHYERPAA